MKRVQHLGPTLKATIKRIFNETRETTNYIAFSNSATGRDSLEMLGNIVFTFVIRMKTSR